MCCQHGFRTFPRAIGKEWRFLAGDLQRRRPEGPQKAVGVAWAKSGKRATCRDDNRPMPILPARLAQRAGIRGVRRELGKGDGRIAPEDSEGTLDACRTREAAIEKRQPFDLAAIDHERRVDRIDAAEREFLAHRLDADLAHLVREPLAGYSVDFGPGAVKSLTLVSANDRANALPHALTPP